MDFLRKALQWFPTVGILIFIMMYYYSALHYPGGSQADAHAVGFSWVHNYWCNLMNEQGMNGQSNPAGPVAIGAMALLCLSLAVFFVQFATAYLSDLFWKRGMQICGTLSMVFAMLMFTNRHDLMTSLSSVFGLFVVVAIIKEIYKSHLTIFKITGGLCLLLLAANNYIYYSGYWIEALPLLQKVTFFVVLTWIVGLNDQMVKQKR